MISLNQWRHHPAGEKQQPSSECLDSPVRTVLGTEDWHLGGEYAVSFIDSQLKPEGIKIDCILLQLIDSFFETFEQVDHP